MLAKLRIGWILVPLALPLLASSADPGVLLEVDRESFELSARDLVDGSVGPRLLVALGSPAHGTPAGSYRLRLLVRNPAWEPGRIARARGARNVPPSPDGPMGIAKITFREGGYAIHGGAASLLLGKPVSLGCVRTDDADLLALIDWLERHDALGPTAPQPDGEQHQAFARPARLVIR
jgi:hypothetical protein